jgi:hypothetical protein
MFLGVLRLLQLTSMDLNAILRKLIGEHDERAAYNMGFSAMLAEEYKLIVPFAYHL